MLRCVLAKSSCCKFTINPRVGSRKINMVLSISRTVDVNCGRLINCGPARESLVLAKCYPLLDYERNLKTSMQNECEV